MNRTIEYRIEETDDGLRVEQFLRRRGYSGQNLTEIKRMPKSILVNGEHYYMRQLLHTGDRLQCKFITAWHHRNSQPQALAVLALQYAGDSLVVQQQYLHLSGWQTLTLEVDSSRKVESIKGYVYLASPWSERPCLLTLTNLHLQCVHPSKQQEHKEPAVEMNAQTDTTLQLLPTPQKQIRDSLMRAEQNERSRSHFQ